MEILDLRTRSLEIARSLSPANRKRMCEYTEAEHQRLSGNPDAIELGIVAQAFREAMHEKGE